jgi:YbbR domain-containing protein
MSHKVKLTYTKSVSSLSYKLNPSYVTVTIKDKISSLETVSYELLNLNKLNSKLSVESVELSKSEVVVKGSKDILNEIASVKALVDLNNNDFKDAGTYEIENVPLVAYDSKGKIIEEVEIVPNSLNATVKLDTYSVTVPLSVQTTGKLVTGKAISKIQVNNSDMYAIEIYGDKDSISQIKSVPVTVNVAGQGANDSKSYTVSLSKPQGVKYMSADTAVINLSFGEEKQKTIEISAENVTPKNLGNGLAVNATNKENISVQVKGVQSVIDTVKPEDISAYIDLSKYTTGDHDVEVKIENNDSRLSFVVNNTIKVKITNN